MNPLDHESWDVSIRLRGGLAGLAPALILAGLFIASDPTTPLLDQALYLMPVAAIAVVAGAIVGPVAAGPRRRLTVGAFAFAVAILATTTTLSVAQGIGDVISSTGLDAVAIMAAAAGRAAVAMVSALYLLLPYAGLGFAWSLAARALGRVRRLAAA